MVSCLAAGATVASIVNHTYCPAALENVSVPVNAPDSVGAYVNAYVVCEAAATSSLSGPQMPGRSENTRNSCAAGAVFATTTLAALLPRAVQRRRTWSLAAGSAPRPVRAYVLLSIVAGIASTSVAA